MTCGRGWQAAASSAAARRPAALYKNAAHEEAKQAKPEEDHQMRHLRESLPRYNSFVAPDCDPGPISSRVGPEQTPGDGPRLSAPLRTG